MKTSWFVFLLSMIFAAPAFARHGDTYSFTASCEDWVSLSSGSLPFGIHVDGYMHDEDAPRDRRGLAVIRLETTNHFFNRVAESAIIDRRSDDSGVTVSIRTDAYSTCRQCFNLTIVMPGGPGTTIGTLTMAGNSPVPLRMCEIR